MPEYQDVGLVLIGDDSKASIQRCAPSFYRILQASSPSCDTRIECRYDTRDVSVNNASERQLCVETSIMRRKVNNASERYQGCQRTIEAILIS